MILGYLIKFVSTCIESFHGNNIQTYPVVKIPFRQLFGAWWPMNTVYITFSFTQEADIIITLPINPIILLILIGEHLASLPGCLIKYRPVDICIATMECLILWARISKCHFVLRFPTTAINPGGNRLSQRSFMAQWLPFHSAGGMVLYTVCSCVAVLSTGTVPKLVVFFYSSSRCSFTDVLIRQEIWNIVLKRVMI